MFKYGRIDFFKGLNNNAEVLSFLFHCTHENMLDFNISFSEKSCYRKWQSQMGLSIKDDLNCSPAMILN